MRRRGFCEHPSMVYFFSGTEQALAMLLSDHFCLCVCPGSDIAALFEQTDNLNDLISPYWRRQRSECSNFCRAVFSFLFIVVFVSLNRASVGFQEPIFLSFFLYSHCITMSCVTQSGAKAVLMQWFAILFPFLLWNTPNHLSDR